jgi:hypothetical protein
LCARAVASILIAVFELGFALLAVCVSVQKRAGGVLAWMVLLTFGGSGSYQIENDESDPYGPHRHCKDAETNHKGSDRARQRKRPRS